MRAQLAILPIVIVWVALLLGQHTCSVDYNALNTQQQTLFMKYGQTHSTKWTDLNCSEQLEFAGATQAIGNWWKFEPMSPSPQPGLEQVIAVDEVHGEAANAPSEAQFNLEVTWKPRADTVFGNAWKWSGHLAWLHPGQYGYQQNRNGNPFLGLVVLFDETNHSKGQFHVGLRSFFGHFSPDNGDIAKHYTAYCKWYGSIPGYKP